MNRLSVLAAVCLFAGFPIAGRDVMPEVPLDSHGNSGQDSMALKADSVHNDSTSVLLPVVERVDADSMTPVKRHFYEKGIIGKIYRYFQESNNEKRKTNFDISFIGGPHYSTEEGFGIGVAASGIYSAGGLADTVTPLSNITLKLDATTGQMFKVGVEGYHIFVNDRYRLNYDVCFYSFKDKWWGIGYDQNKNDGNECSYRRLQSYAAVDFVSHLRDGVFLGPKGVFNYINARDFTIPSLLPSDQSDRTFNTGVGMTFLIDTRDIPTAATRGMYLRVDGISNPGFLGNKYSFSLAEITLSGYRRCWRGGVLAGNFHTRLTWGNTPWGLLSTFGGSHTMRGYWEGRYRDKMEADVTLELRQRVWRRSGFAVWVGTGTVFPKFSQFKLKHLLPNAGLGYRWEFKHGVNVRLDVGFGRGEKSFNFSLNEAF